MRNRLAFLLGMAAAGALSAGGIPQTPPAPSSLSSDSHEGMTIEVEPWIYAGRYKEKFPKKFPLAGGVVAVRVIFRNTTTEGIRVDLPRIRLLLHIAEDTDQELQPLSAEDVADTVLLTQNGKDPTARRNPLPIPIDRPKPSRDAGWTAFRDTCQNAAVPTGVVAAHGVVEGLLYFDLRGEIDLLKTARLYVPGLVVMGSKQPLSYFDIDLGRNGGS